MDALPPIVTKTYDLALWLLPRVNDFPRSYRFILGDRLISVTLDIVEDLIDTSHRRDKQELRGHSTFPCISAHAGFRCSQDAR